MQKSGKLELTWVGKYEQKEIEPRILVEILNLVMGIRILATCLFTGIT